ncbi:MAG: hypothetical protein ABIO04_13025 [Ferruginibacter sp.]
MKKILLLPLIIITFTFTSCKKEEAVNPNPQSEEQTGLSGKPGIVLPQEYLFPTCNDWKISLFQQQEVNNTYKYNDLTFKFCPENTVTMFNDILAINGNWYFMLDKGNPTAMTIDFHYTGTSTPWSELEGTWKVIKLTESTIQLQNDDGSVMLSFKRKEG